MFTYKVSEVKGGALSVSLTHGAPINNLSDISATIVNILLERKSLIRVEKYFSRKCEIFHW